MKFVALQKKTAVAEKLKRRVTEIHLVEDLRPSNGFLAERPGFFTVNMVLMKSSIKAA